MESDQNTKYLVFPRLSILKGMTGGCAAPVNHIFRRFPRNDAIRQQRLVVRK
jgi:hypothetical protein